MRLSAAKGHPDYKPEWLPCYVFLDGEPLDDCVYGDDERGQVVVIVRDKRGEIVLNELNQFPTKILTGRVEFRRDWKHVDAIGFDAWMRNRIETAHQEFMKRTSA